MYIIKICSIFCLIVFLLGLDTKVLLNKQRIVERNDIAPQKLRRLTVKTFFGVPYNSMFKHNIYKISEQNIDLKKIIENIKLLHRCYFLSLFFTELLLTLLGLRYFLSRIEM